VRVSVILCTFNRWQSLLKALDSLAESRVPNSTEWEVLVVDNNSDDRTSEVAQNFCRSHAEHFRYLREPQQGKSRALNTAIQAARSEILAFLDDDVTVDPAWLANLTAPLGGSAWSGVGGRILPEPDFRAPSWMPTEGRYALAPLAVFDYGADGGALDDTPFGANMAYRKELFAKYGGFRCDLGPGSGSKEPQKSEDSEFGKRALAGGERIRYEPSAVVYHEIPSVRVRKEYFLRWWFDKNRSDIRAFGIPQDTKWYVAGVPLYMCRRLAMWTLRWIVAVEESRRFSNKIKVWALAGSVVECYRQSSARGTNGRAS
jgi:glucosyl-dolichyl phosphate glucuronosyltransferase